MRLGFVVPRRILEKIFVLFFANFDLTIVVNLSLLDKEQVGTGPEDGGERQQIDEEASQKVRQLIRVLVHVGKHPLSHPVVEDGSDEGNGDSLRHDRRVEEASQDQVEEVGKVVFDVDDGTLIELIGLSLSQCAGVTLRLLHAAFALFHNYDVVE